MQIDSKEYEKAISLMWFYHHIMSVLTTASVITLSWFSFSPYSPLTQKNPEPDKFNTIAYSVYAGLLIFPGLLLYCMITSFVKKFPDKNNPPNNANNTPENIKKIRAILDKQTDLFYSTAKPEVSIINNDSENMYAFQLTSCSPQYILVNSGYIDACTKNEAGLEILLTHELMHLENDFPYMSYKRLPHLFYVANLLFILLGYMPMQLGFSIAGGVTIGFQSAFVYLPIISAGLMLFTLLNILQEARTRERNADYCALFHGKRFENTEYEKYKKFLANHSHDESCLTRLFDTHPHGSERIALAEATQITPGPSVSIT